MAMMPRKIKFRKHFRGKRAGISGRGYTITFGKYGLKSLGRGWLTGRQIEAARRAMTRYIKREGQVWIRIFPDKSVTKQPAETRMGGGKGALEHFVSVVTPGRILFEMDGVDKDTAQTAMALAGYKLPVKTKFIEKK